MSNHKKLTEPKKSVQIKITKSMFRCFSKNKGSVSTRRLRKELNNAIDLGLEFKRMVDFKEKPITKNNNPYYLNVIFDNPEVINDKFNLARPLFSPTEPILSEYVYSLILQSLMLKSGEEIKEIKQPDLKLLDSFKKLLSKIKEEQNFMTDKEILKDLSSENFVIRKAFSQTSDIDIFKAILILSDHYKIDFKIDLNF